MIENHSPVLLAGTVAVVLAVIPAYGVLWEVSRTAWNTGPFRGLGRVLFTKAIIIAMVLSFSLVGGSLVLFGWGRPLWFEIVRLVVFALIVPVLWAQWYVYRQVRVTGMSFGTSAPAYAEGHPGTTAGPVTEGNSDDD